MEVITTRGVIQAFIQAFWYSPLRRYWTLYIIPYIWDTYVSGLGQIIHKLGIFSKFNLSFVQFLYFDIFLRILEAPRRILLFVFPCFPCRILDLSCYWAGISGLLTCYYRSKARKTCWRPGSKCYIREVRLPHFSQLIYQILSSLPSSH